MIPVAEYFRRYRFIIIHPSPKLPYMRNIISSLKYSATATFHIGEGEEEGETGQFLALTLQGKVSSSFILPPGHPLHGTSFHLKVSLNLWEGGSWGKGGVGGVNNFCFYSIAFGRKGQKGKKVKRFVFNTFLLDQFFCSSLFVLSTFDHFFVFRSNCDILTTFFVFRSHCLL